MKSNYAWIYDNIGISQTKLDHLYASCFLLINSLDLYASCFLLTTLYSTWPQMIPHYQKKNKKQKTKKKKNKKNQKKTNKKTLKGLNQVIVQS